MGLHKAIANLGARVARNLSHSLTVRLGIALSAMICVPVVVLAYIVEDRGQDALLHEKSAKLHGIARLLDSELQSLLAVEDAAPTLNHAQRIAMLHKRVAPFAEEIAQAYPGVGAGYYHRELDAILAYAPHGLYGDTVGRPIDASHPGRDVMLTATANVVSGSQLLGNIMNAMLPIVRDGQVEGYVWANELLDDVHAQMASLRRSVWIVMTVCLLISLALITLFSIRFGHDVGVARTGLQRQMERAEQVAAMGELVAGMAHELRNPLTAVRGFVQYLQHETDPRERREYTAIILKEVDAVNKVIQQLLNFAKPAPQHYQAVQIAGLVNDALLLVRMREVASRIEIVQMLDPDLHEIEADAEMLKQVLLNLLLNAVQSIEDTGRIEISASAGLGQTLILRIRDTGCGISALDREKVFTPFFTTKRTGTGLGLSIVQRIVAAHHGRIDIESEPGCGTLITIDAPQPACPSGFRDDRAARRVSAGGSVSAKNCARRVQNLAQCRTGGGIRPPGPRPIQITSGRASVAGR